MTGQITASPRAFRDAPLRTVIAGLVVLTLVVGAGQVLSDRHEARSADVVLRDAFAVTVTVGAVQRPGVPGETLPRDAVVTTGADGSATLAVRERLVRLGAETTVEVPDGATVVLSRGRILVDQRRGPEITVAVGPLILEPLGRGGLRVDRGFATRVSVYAGSARAVIADRRLEIPRLHSVAVTGRALSDSPAPLRLTGHAWERAIVPEVVSADVTLTRLARGIDAAESLPTTFAVLPAAYRSALSSLPRDAGRSEALLPVAIGEAAGGDARVRRAQQLRSAGASWGVVAALVGAPSTQVAAELAALMRQAPGSGSVAGEAPDGSVGSGAPQSGQGSQPQPSSTGGRPTTAPRPSPSGSASPAPSPSPSEGLVDTIRRLLPTPLPSAPAPVPSLLAVPSTALSAAS